MKILLITLLTFSISSFSNERDLVDEVFGEDEVNLQEINHSESDWSFDRENFDLDPPEKLFRNRSIINWKEINQQDFLDFQEWVRTRLNRDRFPNWKEVFQNTKYHEVVGIALGCFGECKLFRGEKFVSASFRSRLLEGDEIQTEKDSYFLMLTANGLLVRVSPNSSIVTSEINFTNKKNFLFIRLNYGHMYWEPRLAGKYEFVEMAETDNIFYPFPVKEANLSYTKMKTYHNVKKENPFSANFNPSLGQPEQINKINTMRAYRNELFEKRDNVLFVVSANSSILSINSHGHYFYSLSGESEIRVENSIQNFSLNDQREKRNLLYLRGYNNHQEVPLEFNQNYIVDQKGRKVDQTQKNSFQILHATLSRNYSSQLVREILIREKWPFLFADTYSGSELSQKYGYRLWNQLFSTEMYYRFEFLKEYTRRVETTFLNQLISLNLSSAKSFNVDYYGKSLDVYFRSLKARDSLKQQMPKYFDDLDYYIWILKKRGRKFFDSYAP